MRFSIASLVIVSAYLFSAAAEQAESFETTLLGSISQSGDRDMRELLDGRQGCQSGFGLCSNTGSCCPLGGGCCNDGRCCGPGTWCYTANICCPNNTYGCANKGCCKEGSNCCADGHCCPGGSYCYRSHAHNNAIRCCPNGKVCA